MTDTTEPEHDLPDLTGYADEQLDALAVQLETIRETRRVHRTIPGVIASLATQYEAGGGDRGDLVEALTPEQVAALGD